jgi:pimeloyl-ACP methyl ester carboxylesterase
VQTGVLTLPKKLQDMGLTLIHGNQDALCPVENSVHIQRLVPDATLLRIEGAGHDLTDAKMVAAMRQAIESWPV